MSPAYFAMVIATGIVSIASHLLGHETVSIGLFWLNIIFYVNLWTLFLARLIFSYDRFISDMTIMRGCWLLRLWQEPAF